MEEKDFQRKIEDAKEQGRFEGKVLGALSDIKREMETMNAMHAVQNEKIEQKADKSELNELKKEVAGLSKWRYISTGAGAMLGWILNYLSSP